VSQPPVPGVPSSFGPPSYGGYGGDLQSYGRTGPAASAPPPSAPPMSHSDQVAPGQPFSPGAVWPAPQHQPFQAYATVRPTAVPQLPVRRPVFVGMAATMAVTASLQWICALAFLWLVATAGARQLGTSGVDGAIFHLLNRFDDRLLDGLAWPLFGFPLASGVAGLGVSVRCRSAANSPVRVSTGAPLMPLPPKSTPKGWGC